MQPNNQMPATSGDPQNTLEQDGPIYSGADNNARLSQPWQTESDRSVDSSQVERQDWQLSTPSQSFESQPPGHDARQEYEGATVTTDTYTQEASQPAQQTSQEPASSSLYMSQSPPQYQLGVENSDDGSSGSFLPPPLSGYGQPPKKKRSSKKPLFISVAAALIVLAGSAAFIFGYYLPNTPERVWSTGLDRTGDQMTAIVEMFQDPKAVEAFDKTKATLTGTITGTSYGESYDYEINVDSLSDDATSQSMAGLTMQSSENDYDVSADVRTALPDDALFPNIYFKLSGISSLGLDIYLPDISKLDNQWIAIEQDFIEEMLADHIEAMQRSSDSDSDGLQNVTNEDIVSIVADINEVTQDYIFTSDSEKSVIIMESFVSTEKTEGIDANHYKAKINRDNATRYCEAVVDKLTTSDGLKKLYGDEESFTEVMKEAKDDCDDYDPDFDWNRTFDIWIDKNNKIFHKIRVYEDLDKKNQGYRDSKAECVANHHNIEERVNAYCSYYDDLILEGESYYDVGQVFEGEGKFVLFSNFVTDTNKTKSNGRATFSIDAKSLEIGGSVGYSTKNLDNDDSSEVKVTIVSEPYAGEIDSSKPEGAISIREAIGIFY